MSRIGILTIVGFLCAFGKPEHSKVELSLKGKDLVFRAIPGPNMVINFGKGVPTPWTLTISDIKGMKIKKVSFKEEDFDSKVNGFKTTVSNIGKSASFAYRFVAFVCDEKLENCYREVHNGKFEHP